MVPEAMKEEEVGNIHYHTQVRHISSGSKVRYISRRSKVIRFHRWQKELEIGEAHDYNHAATRGVWGHAPPETFSELDALRLLLRPFLDQN